MITPGSTLGILGSGQLGRMIAQAAQSLGYRVHVFAPDAEGSPAGQVADAASTAEYDDEAALAAFGKSVDVVTVEFENVPAAALELLQGLVPVRPGVKSLHTSQNRAREKAFLKDAGLPLPPFVAVDDVSGLEAALKVTGMPAVVKTAASGYDGKGQAVVRSRADLAAARELFSGGSCVVEAFVSFRREISVVAARGVNGQVQAYGAFGNTHVNHILDVTVALETDPEATALATRVADALGHVGVLCLELFETEDGLLVNEIAPRVHNSGHVTVVSSSTGQFEQHVRAVCGLPLGGADRRQPAAMANLLGDLWTDGEPDWSAALEDPAVKLHLYGKAEARPGRKMGHLLATGETDREALEKVIAARRRLTKS